MYVLFISVNNSNKKIPVILEWQVLWTVIKLLQIKMGNKFHDLCSLIHIVCIQKQHDFFQCVNRTRKTLFGSSHENCEHIHNHRDIWWLTGHGLHYLQWYVYGIAIQVRYLGPYLSMKMMLPDVGIQTWSQLILSAVLSIWSKPNQLCNHWSKWPLSSDTATRPFCALCFPSAGPSDC